MIIIAVLLVIVLVALMSCYLNYFIKRIMTDFCNIQIDKKKKRIVRIITIAASLPAVYVFSLYAIIYLHFIVISLVLELLNLILKRFRWYRIGFSLGIFSIVLIAIIFGFGYYNINQIKETDYTIHSDKVSGIKILQITDLHMSNAMDQEDLQRYCDEMSRLDADFVVLTGDIVDERTPLEDMKAACQLLSTIQNKKGIYYIFGNHDPASYSFHPQFNEEDVQQEFEKNGIIVLKDEVVTSDGVTIVGRMDASIDRERLSSQQLLEEVDKSNFILMLDHQPLDLKENAKLGVDLQLSGHTHGGQFFPLKEVQELFTDVLVYGKRTFDGFTAITSSGISAWGYPLRTEGISEYVVINVE